MISITVKAVVFFLASLNISNLPKNLQLNLNGPITGILPVNTVVYSQENFTESFDKITNPQDCKPALQDVLTETLSAVTQQAYLSCMGDLQNVRNLTHPDVGKNTEEIITSYGYPVKIYNVTTKDGYILTVHRIPNRGNTPVYLQHGLGGCSDTWLWQYRNKSMPFLLWEAGYDVWLGNFRGTTYSLGHVSLKWDDPKDFSYWDFSWHENGIFDIPAITDLILAISQKSQLVFLGYSMGSQVGLIALDLVPEINEKFIAAILLAPGGFMARSPNPLRLLSQLGIKNENKYLEPILKGRIDEFAKLNEVLGAPTEAFCTPSAVRCIACDYLIFAIMGFDAPQMNYTNIPLIVSKYPNIMSVKSLYHYAQTMVNCNFAQYSYGAERNLQIYGTPYAPEYRLKNIRVKIYAFHGPADNIFPPLDVMRTLKRLPDGILMQNYQVNSTYFNHADFMIAKDARDLVYVKVLEIMDSIAPARK